MSGKLLVNNTLDIEMLVQSLQAVIDKRKEHDEARHSYEGHSWGYYGRHYVEAAERAAKDFGDRLEALIDARVKAALDAKEKL